MKTVNPGRRVLAVGVFFVFLSGCSLLPEKVLISYDRFEITEEDARLRDQVAHVFYPQDKTPQVGLIQLKNAYVLAAVMERNGHPINDHKLKNETDRIDASSRDPATLAKVKVIFKGPLGGFDLKRYQKIFVLPTYVERTIGTSFFQELPLHAETHRKALDLHAEALKNPARLYDLADAKKILHGKWCLSHTDGVQFTSVADKKKKEPKGSAPKMIDQSRDSARGADIRNAIESRWSDEQKAWTDRWFAEIVAPTRPLALVGPVIDYSESWMVMRLIEKTKKKACFEAALIPKVSFSEWLETEKAKVIISPR